MNIIGDSAKIELTLISIYNNTSVKTKIRA